MKSINNRPLAPSFGEVWEVLNEATVNGSTSEAN